MSHMSLLPANDPKSLTTEDASVVRMKERIQQHIENFNLDALERVPRLPRELEESRNELLPNEEVADLPSVLKSMRERFATADVLARYFEKRATKTLGNLFVFAFIAAVLFGIYSDVEFGGRWVSTVALLSYVLISILAYCLLYLPASRKDYQNKYQDYRALAEGLRVQFFWRLAGLKLSVAEHYLRKQRSELDWICTAISHWNVLEEDSKVACKQDQERVVELIQKYWVKKQLNYFIKSAQLDQQRLEGYEPWVRRLFWAGVILAGLLATLLLFTLFHEFPGKEFFHSPTVRGLMSILMGLPLVGAALLHNYSEKRAWYEQVRQYTRMAQLFSASDKLLSELDARGTYQETKKLIEELGKAALEENGDWVLLHRERPLEPPQAG